MFDRLGDFVYRRRWWVLAASGAFLLVAFGLLARGGELTSGNIEGLEAGRAQALVEQVIGRRQDTTFVAVFHGGDLDPEDQEFETALQKALEPLRHDPAVEGVLTSDNAPDLLALGMVNGVSHAAIAFVSLKGDFKQALRAYPGVRQRLQSSRLTLSCTGQVPFMNDLDATLERDLIRAELVSLPLALLVLLLVFRSVVAAILPVGVGVLAVVGGIAVVLALSSHVDIAQYTINVCSLIGLGVAIDYSLFTVSRYREELARSHDHREALSRAMATAGRMVAFSGVAVMSGLSGLLFFGHSYLWSMGIGGAIVVGLAVIFALTFLPALLAVLGPRIDAGRLPRLGFGPRPGFWHRLAAWVMRRPLQVLLPTLAVLLVLGQPFLHVRLAAADVRVLGPEVEARRGFEELRREFPDQVATRMLIAVRFPSLPLLDSARIEALLRLSARLRAIPGVRKVESIVDAAPSADPGQVERFLLDPPPEVAASIAAAKQISTHGDVVLVSATTDLAPESDGARAIVRAIRADRRVADGELAVAGQTASDLDITGYILERAPRAIAWVVAATLVILFLLLGSVLLPLKAVAMNFVSLAGSFGALVWIFQEGHLFVREPRPLEASLPVLLFCVLFGLSMDYEVLMLSRMRESYLGSHDNTHAVAEGVEVTAGLITSAAAIMVAVFGAFALASVVLIQAVGFGMALAVALDATAIRVLLVPATMRLFCDANWWAPRWMLSVRRLVLGGGAHD